MSRSKNLIIGLLAALLLSWLAGCSAVRLAYGNGAQLSWWWLDGYVDFSAVEEPEVKQDLDEFFAWHRNTQLPGWVPLLVQAETDVTEPATPAQVCRWQARLRDALEPSLEQALALAADLVPGLAEPQFRSIDKRFAKVMTEMREDYLQRDPAERRAASVRRTVERVERLYGSLGTAQKQVIEAGIAASPFDPEAWVAERRRRQRDTLQTLRRLVAEHAGHDERIGGIARAGGQARTLARPRVPRLPDQARRVQLRLRRAHPQRHHAGAAPAGAGDAQGLAGRHPHPGRSGRGCRYGAKGTTTRRGFIPRRGKSISAALNKAASSVLSLRVMPWLLACASNSGLPLARSRISTATSRS